MSVVRRQDGFTLVESLIAMTLMLVVSGVTLGVTQHFERTVRMNQLQNEAQQATRLAADRLARQLRNAGTTGDAGRGFERTTPTDLVFWSIDEAGNQRRVRWCLDSANGDRLWFQTAVAASSQPLDRACPYGAWGNTQVAASELANTGTAGRELFALTCTQNPCATTGEDIETIRIRPIVDVDPNERPKESRLDTAVFLRNQNRAPRADFLDPPSAGGRLRLNGSASQDPDGDRLTYTWFDGSTQIGQGITLDYGPTSLGVHTIRLTVNDGAGRSSSATRTVTVR